MLRTTFKVNTVLRNDFIGKVMIHEVGYAEESDMRGSTVALNNTFIKIPALGCIKLSTQT